MKTSDAVTDFLTWCAVHGYSEGTLRARRYYLASFVVFCESRELYDVASISPSVLDSYQRHLYHQKKANGLPLSFRTQAQCLIPVKGLFAWLTHTGELAYDPSVALALPKVEHRVPEAVLSVDEMEAILAGPDPTTALGTRDRAVLEVFYSTAIRRAELLHLRVADVDHARHTLFVRQGKGARDRFVPIGARACHWVQRYLDEVRPDLDHERSHPALFLSVTGGAIAPDVMSRLVSAYIRAAVPSKKGSCHLFRHTAATLMLDAGADVRFIAEMLGHQKLETTLTYTRVSMVKLQEVHARCHPAEQPRGIRPG
jgi:integrase/recombinase XerD